MMIVLVSCGKKDTINHYLPDPINTSIGLPNLETWDLSPILILWINSIFADLEKQQKIHKNEKVFPAHYFINNNFMSKTNGRKI